MFNIVVIPQTQMLLNTMGEQIKLARLRRKFSVNLVSERAGISRASLWAVEKGSPGVAIGIYNAVLNVLNNHCPTNTSSIAMIFSAGTSEGIACVGAAI